MKNILRNHLLNKLIIILSLLFLLSMLSTVNATDITETDNLGQTISSASNGDVINLDSGTYTNNVTNITIDRNLTIQGKDPETTTIDAGGINGGIFKITPGNTLTLINITLTNGRSASGGAIYNNGGSLTIDNCVFYNNNAYDIEGGAIYNLNAYDLSITNCTFDKNHAGMFGGAISNENVINTLISNCIFTNNTAAFGAAIATENGKNTQIIDSNFTYNVAEFPGYRGAILDLHENNSLVQGCDISNNNHGLSSNSAMLIEPGSNITINYNRFFNNTGYNLYNRGLNVNADYNWWGSNNPDMTKIAGLTLNNYFVMNVINITSLDSNGTVRFNYTFKLNDNGVADNSLLPNFVTDVYTNITGGGAIESFLAKFDRTFDITVNAEGYILYTFVTDDEVKTLDGYIKIVSNSTVGADDTVVGQETIIGGVATDRNGNPLANIVLTLTIDGVSFTVTTDGSGAWSYTYIPMSAGTFVVSVSWEGNTTHSGFINSFSFIATTSDLEPTPTPEPDDNNDTEPTPTPEPDDNNDTEPISNNKTSNNSSSANMKSTGIPISLILIIILNVLGVLIGKKQN